MGGGRVVAPTLEARELTLLGYRLLDMSRMLPFALLLWLIALALAACARGEGATPTPARPTVALTTPDTAPATLTMPAPTDGRAYQLTIHSTGPAEPDIAALTAQATLIVEGTVEQVGPARWTTADGRRPPDPFATTTEGYAKYGIYTPVRLAVHSIWQGEFEASVVSFSLGEGTIGEEFVRLEPRDFWQPAAGQRAVVFLVASPEAQGPPYGLLDGFVVSADTAAHPYLELPLAELHAAIAGAFTP